MPRMLTHFSRAEYGRILDEFLGAGYRGLDFEGASALERHDEPWLILRHDIDFCVEAAREMAFVEAEKGLSASYFFLLRTPFYNLFEANNSRAVRDILGAGHRIGLHFDRMAYPASAEVGDLAAACRREAAALSEWFETEIKVVSYHRPIAREIEGHAEGSFPLLNTYMEAFTKRIAYISDSQGAFRFGHPLDAEAFLQRRPIQLLTHPIWWGSEPTAPLEALRRFAAARGERLEEDMARNCKVFRTGRWAHVKD